MANSVDPDQTAPIVLGPRSLLLYLIRHVRQLFAADDFSRRHFQMHFFLGTLRVNPPAFKLQAEWKTVWILIRWLHQKPADLDLNCFQKKDKSRSTLLIVHG